MGSKQINAKAHETQRRKAKRIIGLRRSFWRQDLSHPPFSIFHSRILPCVSASLRLCVKMALSCSFNLDTRPHSRSQATLAIPHAQATSQDRRCVAILVQSCWFWASFCFHWRAAPITLVCACPWDRSLLPSVSAKDTGSFWLPTAASGRGVRTFWAGRFWVWAISPMRLSFTALGTTQIGLAFQPHRTRTLAVKSDGTLWGWGANYQGRPIG